jgi:DNA repair photolyase
LPARKDPLRVVLTASRRTDLVRWYPGAVVQALATRYPPQRVHSIVLITKFPAAILGAPLRETLRPYDQCAAQVTITGWGGTVLEPKVPAPAEALRAIPDLLDFLGDPRRLRLRLDPLLRLADGRDNLAEACSIMSTAASMGVKSFITSIVTPYAKIAPRLARLGLALAPWNEAEQAAIIGGLADTAASLGVSLAGCCLPGLPNAACIDGRSLQESHPEQLPCRLDHPSGQRKLCGCSHAIDLGWYSSHPCPSGCLYCYANPVADG